MRSKDRTPPGSPPEPASPPTFPDGGSSGPWASGSSTPRSKGARVRARKTLLCTVGPSSLKPSVIEQLTAIGVACFRINMSHTSLEQLGKDLDLIQRSSPVPICIDTEGPQLRTGTVNGGVTVREGSRIRLVAEAISGSRTAIPITPPEAVRQLEAAAKMSVDFDSVVLRIESVGEDSAEARVLSGGEIRSRRAVTALPSPQLPALSQKDLRAIRLGLERGVRQFALSFCEDPGTIARLREVVGPDATILAKIESRAGVQRLWDIAQEADALIIDRGDLSREVRLGAIPLLQKAILRRANSIGVPTYVATNLLESMVTRRSPTRAEVNDVLNTLLDGADGLVLAAETAVGQYPVEAAKMIMDLMDEYDASIDGYRLEDLLGSHPLKDR